MSKFNLLESEYYLVREATRRPVMKVQRHAPAVTPPFVMGVALWFVAMFAVGELILLR
ncbi:hypothetical protein [Phenylobacterium sp.]|jgi:hypothetical protein|uniref:hypothetical protein n=1 Tax=Phenylobacterium sp. TaxID=1871053 RepID=UPI002F41A897